MGSFEGSWRCDAVGKCHPTLSFLLAAFILLGSSIDLHGLGHKANSDPFKVGANPTGVLAQSLLYMANNLGCKLERVGNAHYASSDSLILLRTKG